MFFKIMSNKILDSSRFYLESGHHYMYKALNTVNADNKSFSLDVYVFVLIISSESPNKYEKSVLKWVLQSEVWFRVN